LLLFLQKKKTLIPRMRAFPIFLDLADRDVLLLGEGELAERKRAPLDACGARVRLAPRFTPELLEGVVLAVGAGAPEADLRALYDAARARGIPVNVVDRPELCTFLTPAVVDRDPMTIAIGTGGAAPELARLVRARIEAAIPPAWGRLAALAQSLKEETRRRLPDFARRRRMLEAALDGPVADRVFAGDEAGAHDAYEMLLRAAEAGSAAPLPGIVHLVGAGPGAADLISLRGLRVLGEADVIVHDRLGTSEVLELARRDAARIDVGKAHGSQVMPQAEIGALLVRLAREGRRVVRLKGGDPLVFGRGGEELAVLRAAGIPAVVVPGITAALACAASAGLTLTHRDAADAVTFVTAHRQRPDQPIDVPCLVRPGVTVAVYMGLASFARLRTELALAGFPPDLPVVAVEDGGTARAQVLRGGIETVGDRLASWHRGGPVTFFLGGTAALADAGDQDAVGLGASSRSIGSQA
jgi:uroporphyrin-III C-methyltransferase / precorrin-2 dehydrogenase / sirohydrochlorin ferrochelatase